MVATQTFYFQRSDANLRNEWSNYTNWPYDYLPVNVVPANTSGSYNISYSVGTNNPQIISVFGPGVNLNNTTTGLFVTPTSNVQNIQNILIYPTLIKIGWDICLYQ